MPPLGWRPHPGDRGVWSPVLLLLVLLLSGTGAYWARGAAADGVGTAAAATRGTVRAAEASRTAAAAARCSPTADVGQAYPATTPTLSADTDAAPDAAPDDALAAGWSASAIAWRFMHVPPSLTVGVRRYYPRIPRDPPRSGPPVRPLPLARP